MFINIGTITIASTTNGITTYEIILFLYQKRPFTSENIKSLKPEYTKKELEENQKKKILYENQMTKRKSVKIKNPNQLSMLSPARKFFRRSFLLTGINLNDEQQDSNKKFSKSTNPNILNNSTNLTHSEIDLKKSLLLMNNFLFFFLFKAFI